MTTILIVTGSRCLADSKLAEVWARDQLSRAIHALPPLSVVAHGGALGPDTWADQIAKLVGVDRWAYRLDGLVYVNGEWEDRWTDKTKRDFTLRAWPLHRNAQMVAIVSTRAHYRAQAIALRAPWATTNGTAFTARLCREAWIPVTELSCPAEFSPRRVAR